jgi:hypothetical protein
LFYAFISRFDAAAKQDDPVNFVWIAQNEAHLRMYYQEQAPLHMLLLLKYARRFIQNGHRLPAVPDDCVAATALNDTSASTVVKNWLEEFYEATDGDFTSTTKSENDKMYNTVINFHELYASFSKHLKTGADGATLAVSKKEFETLCCTHSVQFRNSVNNKYVTMKKAVCLREKRDTGMPL